jgi:ribosomal-protein-alanine N-acetyltransferase
MKIAIRTWEKGDVNSLVIAANHESISKTLRDGFPFPYTDKDAEQWISSNKDKVPPTNFAITADGTLAGAIGYVPKDNIFRKNAEIGFWLSISFWNKGITTRAVGLLVDHIFSTQEIDRLYAEVFSNNQASMRVLEKNGFHLEAIHRKSILKYSQVLDDHLWVKFRG